jgi:hypothetical protein
VAARDQRRATTTTGVAVILAAAKQRSDWTNWLATSTAAPAEEARAFLDRALRHLPANAFARVQKRLQRSDAKGDTETLERGKGRIQRDSLTDTPRHCW